MIRSFGKRIYGKIYVNSKTNFVEQTKCRTTQTFCHFKNFMAFHGIGKVNPLIIMQNACYFARKTTFTLSNFVVSWSSICCI